MKFLIGIGVLLCAHQSNAQTSVESWQKNHPDVLFFQSETFYALSPEQQAQLANKVVLFDQEITLADIQQFEATSNELMKSDIVIDEVHGDEIKEWLGSHQHLKIITNTYYNSLTSAEQLIYIQNGTLVLAGNLITLNDIKNYETSY